jgi:hypothetical protein
MAIRRFVPGGDPKRPSRLAKAVFYRAGAPGKPEKPAFAARQNLPRGRAGAGFKLSLMLFSRLRLRQRLTLQGHKLCNAPFDLGWRAA